MSNESPEAFHQRMWREHGPKSCPSAFGDRVTGDALTPDYCNGFRGGVEYAERSTDRLVRGQVADRLWTLLGVKTPADPSLDAALAQAEHVIKYGGMAGSTIALLQSKTRDAALEESATLADAEAERIGPAEVTGTSVGCVARSIRALKSKPAPKECIVPGCVLPPGHEPRSHHRNADGKTWRTDVTDDYIASCAKPESVHDFGWALAQMRAGKKVRRPMARVVPEFGTIDMNRLRDGCTLRSFDLLATDWEVVE